MTLSADERAVIAARHQPAYFIPDTGESGFCGADEQDWPCDTEKMRAALVAAEAQFDAARNALLFTVTNVTPVPHWCRLVDGSHDATCGGMQAAFRGEMTLPRLAAYREAGG